MQLESIYNSQSPYSNPQAAMNRSEAPGNGQHRGWRIQDTYEASNEQRTNEGERTPQKTVQDQVRERILEQLFEAQSADNSDSALSSILYEVEEGVEAAEVPEYWNAENTSQRIVDFAMSFRDMYPDMSDEEYVEQVRDAVQKGFEEAKGILGDNLPGPSAKLFNDTYESTMGKFDEWLENTQQQNDFITSASTTEIIEQSVSAQNYTSDEAQNTGINLVA
jgi:hypothetical protein